MTNVFRTLINVGSVLVIVTFALAASGSHSLARAEALSLIDLSAHTPPRVDLGKAERLAQAASPAPPAPDASAPTVFTKQELERLLCALRAVPRRVAGPTPPGFGLSGRNCAGLPLAGRKQGGRWQS